MLFSSWIFIFSFAAFMVLYRWTMKNLRLQNILILVMSYTFYGYWDWRFLSLLLISTVVDFSIAKKMELESNESKRKKLLWVSILTNLGILGAFKYFNFFAESFSVAMAGLGLDVDMQVMNFILPPGISFYTFQTLGYSIDVYRRKAPAEKNLIDFSVFVAFFPQLIAGPIERAGHLLTQIKRTRIMSMKSSLFGLRLFFLGLFKKLVIADNLSRIVDPAFANPQNFDSFSLLMALYAFTFQIYCDFSGYTDMARGIGKVMGIELSINFNLPYFSKSIKEFWRRWHITLSQWIRDYVYISFGGNREGDVRTYVNLMITMLLCGLWHGAGWTFILWGGYHGVFLAVERYFEPTSFGKKIIALPGWVKTLWTFHVVVLGWLVFRAESMVNAKQYFTHMFDFTFVRQSAYQHLGILLFFTSPLILMKTFQYLKNDHACDLKLKPYWAGLAYGCLLILLILFGSDDGKQFIYFQF